MKIINSFILSCCLFILLSCSPDDDDNGVPPPIDRADPAKNSLSCVINGEDFTAISVFAVRTGEAGSIITGATKLLEEQFIMDGIELTLPRVVEVKKYDINFDESRFNFKVRGNYFIPNSDDVTSGQTGCITITSFEDMQLRGTFEFFSTFDTIRGGKFDVQLFEE